MTPDKRMQSDQMTADKGSQASNQTIKRMPSDDLPYDVDSVDIVVELPELVISEITISPGQEVPWHYHNNVTDTFYCLTGCTWVRFGDGGEAKLKPGESVSVPPGMPHQVEVEGGESTRFLIIQGIGKYDFVPTQAPQR